MVQVNEGARDKGRARRLRRWQRWALLAGAAPAVFGLLASTQVLSPAAAFEGPGGNRGHQQFVLIDTNGAPLWSAEMWLMDGDTEIYHWKTGRKSGGKATWWYTSGDRGRIHLKVNAVGIDAEELDTWIEPTAPAGHCAQIVENGTILGWDGGTFEYGLKPSLQPSTQGCTPD